MWFWVFALSIIYTECVGYFVHRWLHYTKIRWLHDLHMEHHLVHYPGGGSMSSVNYRGPERSTWVQRVGLEWIIPVASITIPFGVLLMLLGVQWQYVLAAFLICLTWAWMMFSYLHTQFHLKRNWMEENVVLRGWYKETRRLHFIHHNDMTTNFGIGFFWYDKLWETFARKLRKNNERRNRQD